MPVIIVGSPACDFLMMIDYRLRQAQPSGVRSLSLSKRLSQLRSLSLSKRQSVKRLR
jgi:hypothetical protein